MIRRMGKRLLLSPLLHCLWLGMALLWVTAEPEPAPVISISEQQIKDLQVQWQLQTGRAPDAHRTAMLIDASIESEVLFQEAMNRRFDQLPVVKNRLQQLGGFLKLTEGDADAREREALKLGLDKTDPLIRRYLVSSMKEVIAAESPVEAPDQKALEAYYQDHKEEYRQPGVIKISHVYFGGFEQDALNRANALLAAMPSSQSEAIRSGDPFFNGHELPFLNEQQLSKKLGSELAQNIMKMETGQWHGPIVSSYGYHLIWINDKKEDHYRPLREVADNIRSVLIRDKRQELLTKEVTELKKHYVIEVADISLEAETMTFPDFSRERTL
ncbi:peptidyl-prolyl cis-trans isomerase [Endozoicomonas arenosclerae]|uniref:peptidylprolyl isomerase n=1 Tax=Endozoicomonas arenosclerae TaxID=1633495 RepID=UPI0009A17F2D|nr:peptidylprolyl isomerase [Endozoicomonas arenosclerae]